MNMCTRLCNVLEIYARLTDDLRIVSLFFVHIGYSDKENLYFRLLLLKYFSVLHRLIQILFLSFHPNKTCKIIFRLSSNV